MNTILNASLMMDGGTLPDYRGKYMKYKAKYLALQTDSVGGKVKPYPKTPDCMKTCVMTHSQNAINYVWLNVLGHGPVKKVEFEEPLNSGKWRLYTDKWWATHCKVVDHDPKNLAHAHIRAFVDPATRFARKRFTFEDGTITEPTAKYYELEQEYFAERDYCVRPDASRSG